ncbi:Subtilisin-like protease SBT5.4 [Sesamum angolense]|uniref:Subtilisin-like protease SBT5.4 n=1 Tax=Sesamum angolense TaxID=2727404 RepID=A0AAE1WT68_9LAMI|nr:Subtilisin-like protease SBT5.4 [Sesamum angolense]
MLFGKFSIFLTLFILFAVFQEPALAIKKSYIVYLGGHSHGPEVTAADLRRVTDSHTQLLASFLGSEEKANEAIIYNYKRHINGFAAVLEEEEAAEIASVIHQSSAWKKARFGEDTIIANLDTVFGLNQRALVAKDMDPFHQSGKESVSLMTRPDPFAIGRCAWSSWMPFALDVVTPRKLIGARYFNKGFQAYSGKLNSSYNTPRDTDGHGSHTLSTAAGNFVPGASVFGVGNGTAKGGSPRARVAAYKQYKMCCVSVSFGLGCPYSMDGLAIAAFHAVKKGVVVVASAGNSGPFPGSVSNVAPWIITVGASTIDRQFEANVQLKNGDPSGHEPLCTITSQKLYPLISAEHAKLTIVEKGQEAYRAGAAGMILCNDEESGNEIIADPHILPALISISQMDALSLTISRLHQSTRVNHDSYGRVWHKAGSIYGVFLFQGPNTITPEILKPDITAPGVNIIAAYSEGVSPTGAAFDVRKTPFNTESGTSMSCPHVSGVAGLIKTLHPDWSPAAIRSAIMTTARIRDNTVNPMRNADYQAATPFAYGSGHIRPNRALDPGLVYDLSVNDYLDFLCGIGYSQTQISQVAGIHYHKCPENYSMLNFNNPSITVLEVRGTVNVTRTVKLVGKPGIYASRVRAPIGYSLAVEPRVLQFEKTGEEKSFKLIITVKRATSTEYGFGELLWSDSSHYVRSPIVLSAADP